MSNVYTFAYGFLFVVFGAFLGCFLLIALQIFLSKKQKELFFIPMIIVLFFSVVTVLIIPSKNDDLLMKIIGIRILAFFGINILSIVLYCIHSYIINHDKSKETKIMKIKDLE